MYAQVLSILEKGVPKTLPPPAIPKFDPTEYTDFLQDSRNYTHISPASTTNPDHLFQATWQRGETVVFEGGAGQTDGRWSAEYFMEHFGRETVHVVDCETKSGGAKMLVSEFFCYWVDPTLERTTIFKLPDWPSHSDFRHKFPKHFVDFMQAVPFPAYSSFNGALNLVA
ncbi:putative JmjC domain-containing histone demethylation protein 2C [Chytriomyces hyalinus]|nr:putative JmjC domain-containing histone demethylation protein 2C [Chytriomyces hyalinus]